MILLNPDLCVIGAGSGGLSVAAGAARLGVPVVLIEKGAMGGDCLNVGCVPSKALIACAAAAHTMRSAGIFGLRPHDARADWAAVQARIRHVIAAIEPNDSVARYEAMGVKVIVSNARFIDRATVEAGGFTIKARRFVVATGSSPAVPPLPGLEHIRWQTNETIFDITELPTHLIVLGAGPIGVELAQAFRRLGSDVTLIDTGAVLAREDAELAAPVLTALAREGVSLRQHVTVLSAEPHATGLRLLIEEAGSSGLQQWITGSHLLVATGRTANVQGLGLEQAGVAFDAHGIKVGRGLRSTNRRIYAVGDVAGGAQFTHAANYHAGLVLRQTLFRLRAKVQPQTIPRVTYSDPEIAAVGLSENEARAQHRDIRVLRWPFSDNDRAETDEAREGHVKIITARNGQILGAGITGAHAGELIGLWCLAIAKGMKIGAIAQLILPYPTLSEASRRAAIGFYASQFDRPIVRTILGWLRQLP